MHIADMLSLGFIQRGIIAGSLIGVLCALLGMFLVLRRLSLIGDGLSHVTFGSVALALFLNVSPLYVTVAAIPLVMLSSVGILRLSNRARMFGDAAIGIVSSLGIAVGVILAGLSRGFNIDLFSYLFGNILSVTWTDVTVSALLFSGIIAAVALFYHDLVAVTFDEDLAQTSGIRTAAVNHILVLLTSLVVVLAMKVVGILLVSALLIFPAVTALQLSRGFRATLVLGCVAAVVSVLAGIFLSFLFNLPSGATIILANFVLFLLSFSLRKARA